MAGDGLDAYDALWGAVASDDDDDVSEVRPVLPQRARSGAPLPRRHSAMPPPYTRDELDRLYAAGCSRYDDDDDDLDADDALAALRVSGRGLGRRVLSRCRLGVPLACAALAF